MTQQQQLVKIEAKELALVDNNTLNDKQLKLLLRRTPPQYIKRRPAKGGGEWAYVSGAYVRKVLNLLFGWDWDFEAISEQVSGKQVIVKGRLTCRCAGRTIVKMQYGCKEIICRKGTDEPLNLGNDFKAAATDALKKCAAELGIAADVYTSDDFREIHVESVEETNDRKERDRIAEHIRTAETEEDLLLVFEHIEAAGLVAMYDSRMAQLKGGNNG